MNQETLSDILASILTTDDKWRQEVESNLMLQNTLEELFSEELFQRVLEKMLLPKFQDTYIPHFRAIELICTIRDLIRQVCKDEMERSSFDLTLQDLELELTDEIGTSKDIECSQSLNEALAEVERLAGLYKENPHFNARLDKFRLIVVPASVTREGTTGFQLLAIKNTRPPRSRWKGRK